MSGSDLCGKRIFIVEDEALIAMSLEDMLLELGCVVAASALTHAEALATAREVEADAAILDYNLGSVTSRDVAETLQARSITVIYATGYGAGGVLKDFPSERILEKPYMLEQLQAVLERVFAT